MFLYKPVGVLFILLPILLCGNCRSDKPAGDPAILVDTAKISSWKKNYDSLFEKYWASKDTKFLEEGGIFADSILFYEPQLLKDTSWRKIFFKVLSYRGLDFNDIRDFVKSHDLLEKYISLYLQYGISQPADLAYAQKTLGNIYSRYGDYKKAYLLLQQSLDYNKQAKDTLEITSCVLNIAIPLKELRRYDEAEQTLQNFFQFPLVDQKRKASACIELADIYVSQHKVHEAGLQIKKGDEFLKLVSYTRGRTEVYVSRYKIEGDWRLASNEPGLALKAYQQSVDSLKTISQNLRNREFGKIYIAIGKALEKLNFLDSALNYYNQALYTVTNIDVTDKFSLPQQKDIYAENTIAEALYARADCIIARGMENVSELKNAVSCYKLAFETERKLLDAFTYDESRLNLVEETRKQAEKAISVCYRLYQKTNDSHWANEAFLFAEHNKAFVLAESVRRNTAASLYLPKDTLYQKVQALQTNLAVLEIELNKQKFSAVPDTGLVQSLTAAKQKTEADFLAAENDLRIKNPEYNDRITNEVSLPAEEIINKTLSTGNALIEYFAGDSSVYAFSAEKNKPLTFHKLPAAVKTMAADFLQFFSNQHLILKSPVQYAAAANILYQSILGPYQQPGNNSLLIIPDGFTCFIPFDALLTAPTTSTDISSFPFLIKQQETYYAFSCKTLLAQAQNKNNEVDNSVAAFAPVFANKERGITPLAHSNDELAGIKQFYPKGKFYTRNEATLKQFEANCSNTGIIHLATHANAGGGSDTAGIEFIDSTLYLKRIYAMPLKARLVVLSGCETHAGAVNRTEGLMSLARGFSYAGTNNVIASLWQTEDNSSAEIFKKFYSNLSGNAFSTSLYKAKLSLINNSSVASASPYYWSGYIYIGTPAENINAQSPGKLKLILFIAGLVLIVLYLFFKRKTN